MEKFKIQNGFSLIELIIVIGLVVIISVIGLLRLSSYKSQKSLTNAVDIIVSVIRSVQKRSITQDQGTGWGVYFLHNVDANGNDYETYKIFSGPSYDGLYEKYVVLPSGISYEYPTTGNENTFAFQPVTGKYIPRGVWDTDPNNWKITLRLKSNPSVKKTISINALGVVTVQ